MPEGRVPDALVGERFDLVVARMSGAGRAAARRWIDDGEAMLDGAAAPPGLRVRDGAAVAWPETTAPTFDPDPTVTFDVIYEDRHLAVVDKPAGLIVHAGAGHEGPTLAAGLLARWPSLEGVGEPGRWGLVHRLDRETSGALLVGLTESSRLALADQLRRRDVHREYRAMVAGDVAIATGTVDAPIDRDPEHPTRRAVVPFGRPARTHYRVVERFPEAGVTRLDVRLETGRTHQIRVHLAAIGHPVVGDRVYRTPATPDLGLDRTWLHAGVLGFTHPVSGEGHSVVSPLPPELVATLEGLSGGQPKNVPATS